MAADRPAFCPAVSWNGSSRSGRVHGLTTSNHTGRPRYAAASTRIGISGRRGQSLPGRAGVGVEGRGPLRFHGLELRDVEPRGLEERSPVRRRHRCRRRGLHLGRDRREGDQPAREVVLHGGRPQTYCGGSLQVTRPPSRTGRRAAGSCGTRRGRPAGPRCAVPPNAWESGPSSGRRGSTRSRCRDRTPRRGPARRARGGGGALRPVLERGRLLLDGYAGVEVQGLLEERDGQHRGEDRGQARPRHARAQALGLARGGDELGRRRLAGGDRRLERVAAREHRGDDEGRRGGGASRLLLEARQDRPLDGRVEVGHEHRGVDRSLVAVPARELGEALALEGAPPGDELVDHEAERVDVAADGHLGPAELLGRHVGRRARAHVRPRERLGEAGEAEVGEPHLALAVEHHVGGLQVAVQQALRVRGRQPVADLARDVDRLVLGEAADAPQQRRRGSPRPRTPSTGSAGPRPRRRPTRGRPRGARPGAPCAPRRTAARGGRRRPRARAAGT